MLNYDFRDQNRIQEADDVHSFSLTLSNLLYQNEGKVERHLRTSWEVSKNKHLKKCRLVNDTVDGRNPAPVDMVVYPTMYRVLYIPGGCRIVMGI